MYETFLSCCLRCHYISKPDDPQQQIFDRYPFTGKAVCAVTYEPVTFKLPKVPF